jgi:hypothetical protein
MNHPGIIDTTGFIPYEEAAKMCNLTPQTMQKHCRMGYVVAQQGHARKWFVSRLQLEIWTSQEWNRLINYLLQGYRLVSIDGYKSMGEGYFYTVAIRYCNKLIVLLPPREEPND